MRNVLRLHQPGEIFRSLDRCGTDQHRAVGLALGVDVLDDRVEFFLGAEVDQVVQVLPRQWPIGRNDQHVESVDVVELEGLGIGGTGHPRQFLVKTEIVLEGGGSQRLALALDRHALLGLDCLMKTLRPAPPRHGTASMLVDDDDIAVGDDVIDVTVIEATSAQRGMNMLQQAQILHRVERIFRLQQPGFTHQLLDLLVPFFRQLYLLLLLVDKEVAGRRILFIGALLELLRERVNRPVELDVLFDGTRNDQWRTRFIDQDRIDLIDDCVVQRPLNLVLQRERHVVAQVVEAVLVIGAVGDVAGVGLPLLFVGLPGSDDTDTQTEKFVERAHPVGVAAGQVVIDRNDMNPLAG